MATPYLGIEIGGTKLQLVAGFGSGAIQRRRRFDVARELGAEGIRAQIESALPELMSLAAPKGIGVGFGGPVEVRKGRIATSHQIEGWSGFDFKSWLESASGLPVVVDNDGNVAALGEATCGAGVDLNPVFYVTMGSGVGGGLVADGFIYHGASPGESEMGHLRLDREGTIVEHRCSGWAVDRRIRAELKAGAEGELVRSLIADGFGSGKEGGEARFLGPAVTSGDALACRILRDVAADLSFALSHVVHLFHPAVIILGGGLSKVGEPLRLAVEEALPGGLMEVFRPGPKVVLAELGEDAVPVGALVLAGQILGQKSSP